MATEMPEEITRYIEDMAALRHKNWIELSLLMVPCIGGTVVFTIIWGLAGVVYSLPFLGAIFVLVSMGVTFGKQNKDLIDDRIREWMVTGY